MTSHSSIPHSNLAVLFPIKTSNVSEIKIGRKIFVSLLFCISIILSLAVSSPLFGFPVSYNVSEWKFYDFVNEGDDGYDVLSDTSMTITAAGHDVWTDADEYCAYYLDDIEGDFSVIVEITFQDNTHPWAKAGIMVRNNIERDATSRGYCMVAVTPDNGFAFQWDSNHDGMLDRNTNTGSSPLNLAPCWLKLVKKKISKNQYNYTAYYSLKGILWNEIDSQDVDHAREIQDIGLFVTSHHSGKQCVVKFGSFDTDNGPIPKTYTITSKSGANGSITPADPYIATENSEPVFTIVPDDGYEIDDVFVNYISVLSKLVNKQYTFPAVTSNQSIEATFSQIIHTITATAGSNGSITPSGTSNVGHNADLIFEVVPNEGYMVDTLTVDGDDTAVLTDDKYEFLSVTDDHTIAVTFKESSTDDPSENGIPGCSTNTSTDYSSGFNASNFSLENTNVSGGKIVLETGNEAINPDKIVIPFTQEVFVTFLFEGASYVSDFGWMLEDEVTEADGSFKGWDKIPLAQRHPLFKKIYDDDETGGCCGGGNGVFDSDYGNGSFPISSESELAIYDDGTGYSFVVDGDGTVSPKDMKKTIGTIAGGTELIFFLTASKRWDSSDPDRVFFTRKDWNPDTYGSCGSGTFDKIYQLGTASGGGTCTTNGGWLTEPAITRMATDFDVSLSGEYKLPITSGAKFSHVIVGAPPDKPNKWILGWEDLMGGGDADHNDMVFHIERRTGGIASLQSSAAIVPEDEDAYFTAVTFEVYDNMPCPGYTEINYAISIDNGGTWIDITDWDEIYETNALKTIGDGAEPETGWVYGSPQYTRRKVRLDFSEKGLSGRALLWKAEMFSEKENCNPQILDVLIDGTVATNGSFSRSEPVIQTNVVYSGTFETPAISWTDKVLRGHLIASQRYAPEDPNTTAVKNLWDAGKVLQSKSPANRKIYYPNIKHTVVIDESLGKGDGKTTLFSGTFAHYPLSALTLKITDKTETFTDEHTDVLTGSLGGKGTINRFTGKYSFNFDTPPEDGVPIKAFYSYYKASSTLSDFTGTNITNEMLGLDSTYIIPDGYTYDMNDDDTFNQSDGDWLVNWIRGYKDGTSTVKDWLLGPIDHSVPAIQVPPGKPRWYYGSAITDTEREAFDAFIETWKERQTVIYVGSRDGMLHAFDGGKYRWGDNPSTAVTENRGYFLWESGTPNYGTGEELWAFIPANLISRLKNNYLKEDDQAYVDASPTIADVHINSAWKTVLLCAQGNGGDTVSCLDVTDPAAPFFMWEFADPDLYRSRSSAAVSQIGRIMVGGKTKWVAFFVSGKTYDNTLYPSVYIVDIEDGSLIKRVFLDDDPDGKGSGKGGTASGQPAVVDSDGNGYIDRIYIGSDKGYMYKINIPDDPDTFNYGITHCIINTDFSDKNKNEVQEKYRLQPVYASPSVTVQNTFSAQGELEYNVKVFFGTGDSPYYDEDINTADTRYHFFAYNDTGKKGEVSEDTVSLDWYMELPEGHRVFASAFAAAENIYFGTSTAETEDPCEAVDDDSNGGKIYAVDIDDGDIKFETIVGNVRVPPLVDDEHLYVKTPEGNIEPFGGGPYNNPVIMGAVVNTAVRSWKELSE